MARRLYGWPAPTGAGTYAVLAVFVAGSGLALQLSTTALVLVWGPPAGQPLLPAAWTQPLFLALASGSALLLLAPGRRALGASACAVCLGLAAAPLYNPLFFVVALAHAGGLGIPLAILVPGAGLAAVLAHSLFGLLGLEASDVRGSTRWGSGRALRGTDSGLLLGRLGGALLRYDGDGHLMTIAATRSGKGVGSILPNLLSYEGSIVVTDPKGENYLVTARYRRERLGQEIVALDPFGIAEKAQPASFNPMDLLDMGGDGFVETAMMMADMMVPGSDSFWNLEAKALLHTFILHAAKTQERRHLIEMRRLLALPPKDLEAALAVMLTSDLEQVREGAGRILQKADRERSSVFSTAQSRTHFLSSPRMRRVLEQSSFQMDGLVSGGMTVYLILPREHLTTFAPWLRLMISCCYYACTHGATRRTRSGKRVLFLLDEFANLGYMSNIREAVSLGGGYGLTLWLILQDLAQLRREYQSDWESFVANCDVIQAFAIQDPFTSDRIARMLGETSVWQRRVRRASRREGGRLVPDYDEEGRPLLRPEELRRLHPARQLLLVRPYQPVVADKLVYYLDALLTGRFDDNPYVG